MKFFSVHHCVLIFLTLIFTTAPASADVTIWGRLHQPVTLTCKHVCAPRVAKWNDLKTRSVFAQCDETSCSSQEGYKMSHDQYVKGDLSLTITAADYSKRNTYACECGAIDYSIQRLRIATVFSAVQMRPAEDLLLDLSVPEPVKVFYRSSDSADDELICNVTQSSAQCSSKYTSRTSLHHLQLTLRGVTSSDSGTYTIQNTEYNEDIIVYHVSVRGLSKGMITLIVLLLLLLLLLVIIGIIIYGCIIYMKMKRRMEEVKRSINQIESVNKHTLEEQREMKKLIVIAEEKINDLEEDYRENRILSARVKRFCSDCRSDLEIYKTLYLIDMFPVVTPIGQEEQMKMIKQIEKMKQEDIQQLKRRMKEVKRIINQMESVNKHTLEGQRELKMLIERAEEKNNDLEEDYRENRILSPRVTLYCSDCRSDLEFYKTLYLIDFIYPDLTTEQQEEQMKMIKQIEQMKQEDKQKLKSRIKEVKRSIKQIESVNKDTPEGQEEMKNLIYNTQWKINNLEKDYRENRSLSARVKLYCTQHRSDLDTYQTIYEKNMSTEPYITEQMKTEEVLMKIERVVKILQMLKHGESKEEKNRVYQRVESELEEIRDWCSEQTEDLDPETQQGGEGDSKAMRKMNALINVFRNWCFETERELKKHKKINNDPTTTKLPLLPPERGTESSPDQVEVLDEGVALMPL